MEINNNDVENYVLHLFCHFDVSLLIWPKCGLNEPLKFELVLIVFKAMIESNPRIDFSKKPMVDLTFNWEHGQFITL